MDENEITTPIQEEQLPVQVDETKGQHKALKSWSTATFVLSCIATGLVVVSLILPFFLMLIGVISVLLWIVVIIFGTIITLGMIWLVDETKSFNSKWMAFNEKIFASSNEIADKVLQAFPIMVVIGGIILLACWSLLITGLTVDKSRKKRYMGLSIALGVLTGLFIVISVLTLVNINKQ